MQLYFDKILKFCHSIFFDFKHELLSFGKFNGGDCGIFRGSGSVQTFYVFFNFYSDGIDSGFFCIKNSVAFYDFGVQLRLGLVYG